MIADRSRAGASVFHPAVMVPEVVEYLNVAKGIYVDATVGGGSMSAAILEQLRAGQVIGIDLDSDALEFCRKRFESEPRIVLVHGNFTDLERLLESTLGIERRALGGLAGVVFDLGLSRHAAVTAERGFSYRFNGPLDMRFDRGSTLRSARELVAQSSETELSKIIRDYGEERFFRRIGRRIARHRREIRTTSELAAVVRKAVPSRYQARAVMRVFQALRIAVNNELENLRQGLEQAIALLGTGGRVCVLSYHSLEDRICKQVFRAHQSAGRLRILTRRPVRPSEDEIDQNPSARSARLRVAEALGMR